MLGAMFAYTVRCAFRDEPTLERWSAWLLETHLADVCDAGALRAELVRLDGELACEARYLFASREAFAAYERDHAPRLRQEGLALFPPEALGLRYTRSAGEIRGEAAPRG